MNCVKILHCADVHIGSNLKTVGRKGSERKAEIKDTFLRILKICKTSEVQLLLLAGDIFDGVQVPEEVLEEIREGLEQIKGVVVAIAPGNHDPYTLDSPYCKKGFWPDNVIIFKKNMDYVELNSLNVRLFGGGFTKTYETESFLRNIPMRNDDYINICVLHGMVGPSGQKVNYNPISETDIKNSHMDYIALGHIHERTEPKKVGNTYFAYSGCPEGRGFDELGEKGFYLGTVSKGSVDLEFVKICKRMNLEEEVDISDAQNAGDMAALILEKLKEKYQDSYQEHLYKIILKGTLSENISVRIDDIKAKLDELYFVKVRDNTTVELDFENISSEMTLRGIYIRKMLERLEVAKDKEREVQKINDALNLGLKAFFSEVNYHEN